MSSSAGHIRCSRQRLSTAQQRNNRYGRTLRKTRLVPLSVRPSVRVAAVQLRNRPVPSLVHRSESEGWIGDRPGIYLFKCQKTNDSNEWPSVIFKCPTKSSPLTAVRVAMQSLALRLAFRFKRRDDGRRAMPVTNRVSIRQLN